MDFLVETDLPEAKETTFTYDDLMRTATLTLPFDDMAISKDTDVPFTVIITENVFSEEYT